MANKTPLVVVNYVPKGGGPEREHSRFRVGEPEQFLHNLAASLLAVAAGDLDPDQIVFRVYRPVVE